MVQDQVFRIYNLFASIPRNAQTLTLEVQRDKHLEYLTRGLQKLGPTFACLDANRPWLCYWILHSITLLGESVDDDLEHNVIDFLWRCQDPNGGYGGGPGQMPHVATTYAAINSLVTLGSNEALSSINRGKLYTFLRRMKDRNGAFRMHDAGEIDVRACYMAISVASILNILDDELIKDMGSYIVSCQTYEGGIAGEPGSEAHGGYTFCGLAAMILIKEVNRLDLTGLIVRQYSTPSPWIGWYFDREWSVDSSEELTNWLMVVTPFGREESALLQRLHSAGGEEHLMFSNARGHSTSDSASEGEGMDGNSSEADETDHLEHARNLMENKQQNASHSVDRTGSSLPQILDNLEMEPLFHNMALQQYILLCSQEQDGGFRDKPGKARDFYHTCYCLSGLSVSQYSCSADEDSPPLPRAVLGPYSNLLEPIHPLYNVVSRQYRKAHEFFKNLTL